MSLETISFALKFFVAGSALCIVAGTVLHAIFSKDDK